MKESLYGHNHHHAERSSASPPPPMSPPLGVQRGRERLNDSLDELDVLLHQAQLYVSLTEPPPPTSPSLPKRDKTRGQDYYHISSLTTTTATTSPPPTKTVTPSAMASASPPPRPSRANTANLNDVYATQPTPLSQRRISAPIPINQGDVFYANPNEQMPPVASTSQSPAQIRSRSGTTKGKKGMLGFMSDFLGSNKPVAISTPYDPVHLTHVGFNSSTGEFTGLPKEWQQLLQESGISRMEQEKNPQAVMEIVKFYQEGGGDVWDKMGAAPAPPRDEADAPGSLQTPVSHLAFMIRCMHDPQWLAQASCPRPTKEDAVQPFTCTHLLQASAHATTDRFSFSGSVHITAPPVQVPHPEPANR